MNRDKPREKPWAAEARAELAAAWAELRAALVAEIDRVLRRWPWLYKKLGGSA